MKVKVQRCKNPKTASGCYHKLNSTDNFSPLCLTYHTDKRLCFVWLITPTLTNFVCRSFVRQGTTSNCLIQRWELRVSFPKTATATQ